MNMDELEMVAPNISNRIAAVTAAAMAEAFASTVAPGQIDSSGGDSSLQSTMQWIMTKMDQFPIKISFFFSLAMVLGSVVPYVPQYLAIKQSQNTEGFSLYVCLTLLVANILRIMFWFGKPFDTALLIQSIVMIFAMFVLLELCVRVRNSNLIVQNRKRYFADFDYRYFWDWTDFISYIECMAVFTFISGFVMFLFVDCYYVVEGYGVVALVTESLLASPQFLKNFKTKSTEGMSRMMVFTWLIGDLYKTIYFISTSSPFQFLICGGIQITFDVMIFIQILVYKKDTYRKLSKSRQVISPADQRRLTPINVSSFVSDSPKNSQTNLALISNIGPPPSTAADLVQSKLYSSNPSLTTSTSPFSPSLGPRGPGLLKSRLSVNKLSAPNSPTMKVASQTKPEEIKLHQL